MAAYLPIGMQDCQQKTTNDLWMSSDFIGAVSATEQTQRCG
jgi:hypothetical protein